MFIRTLALFVTFAPSFAAVQSAPLQTTVPRNGQPDVYVYGAVPRTAVIGQDKPQTPQGAWLGVSLSDGKGGPTVGQVVGNSPAAQSGFTAGDRLVSLDGKAVASTNAVIEIVHHANPGSTVAVQVRREVTVALDDEHKSAQGAFLLGVELGEQRKVGDDDAIEVKSLLDGSPAQNAGIEAGDALINVEGKHVASSAHVTNALKSVTEAREVRVEIARTIEVTLGKPRAVVPLQLAQPRSATPPPVAGLQSPKPAAPPVGPQPPKNAKPKGNQLAAPRARTPAPADDQALLDEVRALSNELRELRDQIAALRGQLEQLQSRR